MRAAGSFCPQPRAGVNRLEEGRDLLTLGEPPEGVDEAIGDSQQVRLGGFPVVVTGNLDPDLKVLLPGRHPEGELPEAPVVNENALAQGWMTGYRRSDRHVRLVHLGVIHHGVERRDHVVGRPPKDSHTASAT